MKTSNKKTTAESRRTAATSAIKVDIEKTAKLTKKPEPKATAKAAPAARKVIPGDLKITVVAKENPRHGETARKTFATYRNGMTVSEFREACAAKDLDAGYLGFDIRRGYIKVG